MQLPTAFLTQMKDQLGPETEAFLDALSGTPPTSIHFNIYKNFNWEENFDGVKWYSKGVYLPERPVFTLDPAFHAGAYYVQEASSMLIAAAVRQLIDLEAPLNALDLCAAPGGKTTLLASLLPENSLLVANEVIRSRYQVLDYNLTKWGISNKLSCSQDAAHFKGLKDFFDLILVDAPCSGEGLFRKDPKAINEWSPESVLHCSNRQKRILEDTIGMLKPGGVLLYSTCTFNDRENSGNARWLIQEFPLQSADLKFPDNWGIVPREIGHQCYPHRVPGEGFYLAAFWKSGGSSKAGKPKSAGTLKYYRPLSKDKHTQLHDLLAPTPALQLLENEKGQVIALPESVCENVLVLNPYIRYSRPGTAVGSFKGKDFIPDPALALSGLVRSDFPAISVDRDEALRFLRKESPELPPQPAGWHLLQYKGLNLGWVKVLKNRINNYYPKEWRIRMS